MATAFVIHHQADAEFITGTLLKPLPSLGFERWVSAAEGSGPTLDAVPACQVFIVVVSEASRQSLALRALVERALAAPQPTIAVQVDGTEPEQVASGLRAVPKIDPGDEIIRAAVPLAARLRDALPLLLPPIDPSAEPTEPLGVLIEWNEDGFSSYLRDAMAQHDFNRGQALLSSLARHLSERPYLYSEPHARADLKVLRDKRQFALMERYSDLIMSSGTQDLEVRRQRAQALIELARMTDALPILEWNAETAAPGEREWLEAHGLLGRLHKQLYINAPSDQQAPDHLRLAIAEYRTVYDNYSDEFWHGVNAASCLMRAHREGFDWATPADAREIAGRVIERLDAAKVANNLHAWDVASRVEALIALEQFSEASLALDDYLAHPELNAFAVGSTFRQFDEVLQLNTKKEGQDIYDRLARAVDRMRAGGATSTPQQRDGAEDPNHLPVLIHVSDPGWTPSRALSGLRISSRMGTVIAAHASRAAISALLKDTLVISIEESRELDCEYECAESIPFIRVSDRYSDTIGLFSEKGGGALIALIDDGIDVLHEAFVDDHGRSRILGIWDQRDKTGSPPLRCDYGRFHSEQEIAGYLAARSVPCSLTRNVKGHGTHVASIAAGRAADRFAGGVAPEAGLLVVIAKFDGDIGYSKAHVDALAFIDRFATLRELPVVVNISKGSNAGAHDGKSALEVAFDEFAGGGRKPGRVVIKSAGNERGQNRHAALFLGTGEGASLPWNRSALATTKFERLELWWDSSDDVRFRLGYPGGVSWSEWVTEKSADVAGTLGRDGDFHMQLTKLHVDNGDSQLRVEIGGALGGVKSGVWTLQLQATCVKSGRALHAWIERGGAETSAFEDWTQSEMTLTVPGTAESVITVGAIESNTAQLGRFSSFGPTRDGRMKPDLVAPGVDVMAACGGTDRDVRMEAGTSMAAPHVAGAVALALSRAVRSGRRPPAANQIRAAMTRKTRSFNGHHDPGRGYGILDVTAFLGAF